MGDNILKIVGYFVLTWVSVSLYTLTHELGHYIVGRYIVKIPKARIKLQLRKFPAFVSLKGSDGKWIEPNDANGKYTEAYGEYDKTYKYAVWYIMAGFIFQTVIWIPLINLLSFAPDLIPLCKYMVVLSAAMIGVYVIGDFLFLAVRKMPYGDAGAALQIAPVKTVCILMFVAASHALLFVYR